MLHLHFSDLPLKKCPTVDFKKTNVLYALLDEPSHKAMLQAILGGGLITPE